MLSKQNPLRPVSNTAQAKHEYLIVNLMTFSFKHGIPTSHQPHIEQVKDSVLRVHLFAPFSGHISEVILKNTYRIMRNTEPKSTLRKSSPYTLNSFMPESTHSSAAFHFWHRSTFCHIYERDTHCGASVLTKNRQSVGVCRNPFPVLNWCYEHQH